MKSNNPSSFIQKLYNILEKDTYNEILSWNADGTGFLVKNISQFQQIVLPVYFKHSNFSSFVRQLNMYGFHKTRNQEFSHELFIKGEIQLLSNIKRKALMSEEIVEKDNKISISDISQKYDEWGTVCRQLLERNHEVLRQNKKFQKHFQLKTKIIGNQQLCLTNGDNN